MPNGDGTAADYAHEAARGAEMSAQKANERLQRLLAVLRGTGLITAAQAQWVITGYPPPPPPGPPPPETRRIDLGDDPDGDAAVDPRDT